MKLVLLSCLLIVACQARAPSSHYILSDEYIDHLNKIESSWTAGRNFDRRTPIDHLKRLCGVKKHPTGFTLPLKQVSESIEVPTNYDARQAYPHCPSVSEIRDQGACGSCWAFGAVESMSDRYCIHTNGTFNFHVSADDLVSCCTECGAGCNGGYPAQAWQYWVDTGIVSGGPYHSGQGCRPYEIHPCGVPPNQPTPPECKQDQNTPNCVKTCDSNYTETYQQDIHTGKTAYSVGNTTAEIQAEIFENGPVEATMAVYEDFMSYKSGVYHHVQGDLLGYHAIRMLGWGKTDDGTDYWVIANSWGRWWGDKGYFLILRGSDECGIESGISAGLPTLY